MRTQTLREVSCAAIEWVLIPSASLPPTLEPSHLSADYINHDGQNDWAVVFAAHSLGGPVADQALARSLTGRSDS